MKWSRFQQTRPIRDLSTYNEASRGGLEYHTVESCSNCTDLSSQVKKNDIDFTLPSGLFVTSRDGKAFTMRATLDYSTTIEILYGLTDTQEIDCTTANTWTCRGYGAARCAIYPCVRSFAATVRKGKLTEVDQSTVEAWGVDGLNPTWGFGGQNLATVDMGCLDGVEKDSLRRLGYSFDETTQWLAYYVSVNYTQSGAWDSHSLQPTSPTAAIVPANCIYQVDLGSQHSLDSFLTKYSNGTLNVGVEALFGNSILERIFNDGNMTYDVVSSTFSHVSNAMTQYIRQNGNPNGSAPAVGKVYHSGTCVRVRWAWLIFPAALVELTVGFFVGMILQTRSGEEGRNHDYKSSVLPLMFHGLEQAKADCYSQQMGRVAEINKGAKQIFVRLCLTEKGWKFIEVDDHDEKT